MQENGDYSTYDDDPEKQPCCYPLSHLLHHFLHPTIVFFFFLTKLYLFGNRQGFYSALQVLQML